MTIFVKGSYGDAQRNNPGSPSPMSYQTTQGASNSDASFNGSLNGGMGLSGGLSPFGYTAPTSSQSPFSFPSGNTAAQNLASVPGVNGSNAQAAASSSPSFWSKAGNIGLGALSSVSPLAALGVMGYRSLSNALSSQGNYNDQSGAIANMNMTTQNYLGSSPYSDFSAPSTDSFSFPQGNTAAQNLAAPTGSYGFNTLGSGLNAPQYANAMNYTPFDATSLNDQMAGMYNTNAPTGTPGGAPGGSPQGPPVTTPGGLTGGSLPNPAAYSAGPINRMPLGGYWNQQAQQMAGPIYSPYNQGQFAGGAGGVAPNPFYAPAGIRPLGGS